MNDPISDPLYPAYKVCPRCDFETEEPCSRCHLCGFERWRNGYTFEIAAEWRIDVFSEDEDDDESDIYHRLISNHWSYVMSVPGHLSPKFSQEDLDKLLILQ